MSTMGEAQRAIISEMAACPDWFAKYEYLLAGARALRPMDGELKRDPNRIDGCQSQVWIAAEMEDGRFRLTGDSDAQITRGIIALLIRVLDGRAAGEVADADLFFVRETGLATNLSPSRANGLALMIRRIKALAAGFAARP